MNLFPLLRSSGIGDKLENTLKNIKKVLLKRMMKMKKELASKYDHKSVEKGKYQHWLEKEYFKAGDVSKSLMQSLFHHLT